MEKEIFRYLKWAFGSFTVLFILVIIFIFTPFFSKFDFTKSGVFGDTIAGLSAAFIGSLGVIFTFLAFWSQFQANQLQAKQFQKQNEDGIFFRLVDTQNLRITNSSIAVNAISYGSFQLLEQIVKNALQDITSQTAFLARQLICEDPEKITPLHYRKMFELNAIFSDNPTIHVNEIFDSLMGNFFEKMKGMKFNERWEFIKVYFNSSSSESNGQLRLLTAIGSVQFYKIDFSKRLDIYDKTMQNIDKAFGSFLDGYIKGWEFIAVYCSNSLNRKTYHEFLSAHISKYELIILFYYLASGRATKPLCEFAQQANIFHNLPRYNDLLIDVPSELEIENEIENVYTFYGIKREDNN